MKSKLILAGVLFAITCVIGYVIYLNLTAADVFSKGPYTKYKRVVIKEAHCSDSVIVQWIHTDNSPSRTPFIEQSIEVVMIRADTTISICRSEWITDISCHSDTIQIQLVGGWEAIVESLDGFEIIIDSSGQVEQTLKKIRPDL